MLLMSTYVASVTNEEIDEVRAQLLQMHVNLVSVRCLSATYRHRWPISQPEATLCYSDYYSDFWRKILATTRNRSKTRRILRLRAPML